MSIPYFILVAFPPATAVLKEAPALNLGEVLAAILIVAPVAGFLPVRAARLAVIYQVGYLHAPMLPMTVQATCCPVCTKPFFVEDASELDQVTSDRDTVPVIEAANSDVLLELIEQTEDQERMRYLRVQVWHKLNHPLRGKDELNRPRPSEFDENLEQLIGLLVDDKGQGQLMKAEALRELGRHDESIATLNGIDPSLAWVTHQIRTFAENGDAAVRTLDRPK